MKKLWKRWVSVLLALVLLCTSVIVFPADEVSAASAKKPSFEVTKRTLFLGDSSSFVETLSFKNISSKAKIEDVAFSNPEVLKGNGIYSAENGIYCRTLKTGTCKVSCKVVQNGKTYKLSMKVTVKRGNPFSYVKIAGENVYSNGTAKLCNYTTKNNSVKVKYKLKDGWKLKRMYTNDHYTKNGKTVMTKDKNVKNGSKISIKKEYTSVKIDVENKKGEVYRYLILLKKPSGTSESTKGTSLSGAEIHVEELGQVLE